MGTLKETPRSDILEEVWCILDFQDGIEAIWKVSSGRSDKTRWAYFEVGEGLNPLQLKVQSTTYSTKPPRIPDVLHSK